uniref:far upstream element-binding protein 1-like n=1 Tax=Erigeron canadensis TaxID=72917 RepID=UPI001CB88D18|nr:far upstream element-binding protein 1-like [Erigeron canadensis]
MADEQITDDHKRKLHDLNAEPLSTANSTPQPSLDGPSPAPHEDPEPKRPRFDNSPDKLVTENGQHEKLNEDDADQNNEQDVVDKESGEKEKQRDAPAGATTQSTSAGQPASRKVDVPNNKVGVLIGKSGDTIRTLEQNSGARVHITRDSEVDPGSTTRPVEIVGSLESIKKAEKLIKDVIAEADAGGSPLLVAKGLSNLQSSAAVEQVQIQVPNDKVKFIIGKGGETIKNLQTRSGARIQCIPQHLPEGDQSKERTVKLTGDMRQIEMAKDLIIETINQTSWPAVPTSDYKQQNSNSRGPGSQWGPRSHPSQLSEYNHPQRGPYPSQNSHYFSQGYENYPPQRPPSRNNFGWEGRPPANMQGPPDHVGYDYNGRGTHTLAASGPGSMTGPPPQANYNYGQPKGPDYGQQPPPYPPHGYVNGYGEPKYDNQGPVQHLYGTHGPPPSYNAPQQAPYGQPYGQPRPSQQGDVPYQGLVPPVQSYGPNAPAQQQPYLYASSGPMQQGYTQYPAASQQIGQPVSAYTQPGAPQQAPGYTQSAPTASYGLYPATQPGFTEQAPTSNAGYGNQGAADGGAYVGGPGTGYGPSVGPPVAYSQPAPIQPGYSQSAAPQAGGYGNVPISYGKSGSPQHQAPPVYAQYDNSQMYAGHR